MKLILSNWVLNISKICIVFLICILWNSFVAARQGSQGQEDRRRRHFRSQKGRIQGFRCPQGRPRNGWQTSVGCHHETSRRRFTKGLYEGHLFTQQRTVPSHHGFLNIVSSMSESEYKTSCVEKNWATLVSTLFEEFLRCCTPQKSIQMTKVVIHHHQSPTISKVKWLSKNSILTKSCLNTCLNFAPILRLISE